MLNNWILEQKNKIKNNVKINYVYVNDKYLVIVFDKDYNIKFFEIEKKDLKDDKKRDTILKKISKLDWVNNLILDEVYKIVK